MMIKYINNSAIDYNRWDDCIKNAFNGNVYAWSWYLDIVCEGWDALVLGDYEQVMPVTHGRKFGISYLYQPPFSQQLGVFSMALSTNLPVDGFLEKLSAQYRFAEINLNRYNKSAQPSLMLKMRRNYELELIKPIGELRKAYSANTTRNIRKAENEGISIAENVDPQSIISMFRQHKGASVKSLGDKQYQMLDKLMYRGSYKKQAYIIGAYDNKNHLCAGAFLLKSHHRIVFLFSANNQTARQAGVMHMLVDSIIEKFSGQAITLDFEGSEIPGLARFYASFGSTETHYPAITFNHLPLPVRAGIKALKLLGLK